MTGCKEPNLAITDHEPDQRMAKLVPEVISLLHRVTSIEPSISATQDTDLCFRSPITFPDGIGEGTVVAELFIYREKVRFDVSLEHNRVFATADGSPTERRCYLNDYMASQTVEPETEEFPPEFIRSVVAGLAAARDAVKRHNRRANVPWNQVNVAASVPEPV
ncbi:MAG: hypothetical protein OEY63_07930 [Gemmatimonadota bacterium]|nr:hypothetical protein [Gemmatimonadota bacterium]